MQWERERCNHRWTRARVSARKQDANAASRSQSQSRQQLCQSIVLGEALGKLMPQSPHLHSIQAAVPQARNAGR